jgi:hypothetical protein
VHRPRVENVSDRATSGRLVLLPVIPDHVMKQSWTAGLTSLAVPGAGERLPAAVPSRRRTRGRHHAEAMVGWLPR